jgi:hypothetical protein
MVDYLLKFKLFRIVVLVSVSLLILGMLIKIEVTKNSIQTQTQIPLSVSPPTKSTKEIVKSVYLVVFNPVIKDGTRLTDYMRWNDPYILSDQAVNFFEEVSESRIRYQINFVSELNDFPVKQDGFVYNSESYVDVLSKLEKKHNPDWVDYYNVLNDESLDVCGRLNRGEIDELWLWGGPWFGYYESALATSSQGPEGFFYNGPTFDQFSCNRLMPIMGFNYERGLPEMIHNWGHRAEDTMKHVYKGWQQNRISHNWDAFGLVDDLSPNYSYSGCGSVHFPPNGQFDYDYANTRSANSYCNDFFNYPNLSINKNKALESMTCAEWGCSHEGYLRWWFGRIPSVEGIGNDGVLNDWWVYIIDPNTATNGY